MVGVDVQKQQDAQAAERLFSDIRRSIAMLQDGIAGGEQKVDSVVVVNLIEEPLEKLAKMQTKSVMFEYENKLVRQRVFLQACRDALGDGRAVLKARVDEALEMMDEMVALIGKARVDKEKCLEEESFRRVESEEMQKKKAEEEAKHKTEEENRKKALISDDVRKKVDALLRNAFIHVDGGEFDMGYEILVDKYLDDAEWLDDEYVTLEEFVDSYLRKDRVRKIQVSDFIICKFTVTQSLYKCVMGMNPSQKYVGPFRKQVGSDYPVNGVTWFDAI